MNKRVQAILRDLSRRPDSLPGVFSTPQRGGRAYQVPEPNGNPKKPKLVAFVAMNKARDAIGVQFKLTRPRAEQVIYDHDWISPHSFRTLAPAGWVRAKVTGKRQLTVLTKLLTESRALYPTVQETQAAPRGHGRASAGVLRRGAGAGERRGAPGGSEAGEMKSPTPSPPKPG